MSHSLQDTVEKFKVVMEEMHRKMIAMRERTDEAYKKINQLEIQKYSSTDRSKQLNKALQKFSCQVAFFEDQEGTPKSIYQIPRKEEAFAVQK